MPEVYVTIKELSEKLGLDRSNTRKFLKKYGFSFVRVRTPETRGQLTLALTKDEAEAAIELRESQGFTKTGEPVQNNGEGYFYMVKLVPEFAPNRVKLGFATDVEARLQAHRTSAPTATLVKAWECKKTWEDAAIASITRIGCKQLSNEVFDCEDIESLLKRAEDFFAIMPVNKKKE